MSHSVHAVYLHIGLHKTGTTYLQALCSQNTQQLERVDIAYAPSRLQAHHDQARDLRGSRPRGHVDPHVPGSWDVLVRAVHQNHRTSLISSELLAPASSAQAQRALEALRPLEVHLVVTVRDAVRQIPALWQETVKNGSVEGYPEFLERVRRHEEDPAGQRLGQWSNQDLVDVLRRWRHDLPPERIHVVTVPRAGSEPGVLSQRFLEALGVTVPMDLVEVSTRNTSLGPAETEVVRGVNREVTDASWPFYARHVKRGIAQGVLAGDGSGAPLRVPESMVPVLENAARRTIDEVRGAGYHVVGDLEELLPAADDPRVGELSEPEAHDLAEASERVTGYLVAQMHTLWSSERELRRELAQARDPGVRALAKQLGPALIRAVRRRVPRRR